MSAARGAWLLLGWLAAAACTRPVATAPPGRWIETPNEELLRPEEGVHIAVSYELDFTVDSPATRGFLERAAILSPHGPEGLVLRPQDGSPRLRLPRRFTASEVGVVEVTLSGLERGRLAVLWQDRGELLGRRELDRLWAGGPGHDLFTFDLSGALPVDRSVDLIFELTSAPGEVVALRRLRVGHAALTRESWQELAARPWKASLSEDMRNVLVAPPDGEISRRLPVPEHGVLHLGAGVLGPPGSTAGFAVLVRAPGRSETELWRETVAGGARARWRDVTLHLERWRGQEVEIALRAATAIDAAHPALPLWSAPEVREVRHADASRPNLVLIVVDTLRADRLSLYGYERETTPHLDAWARRRGVVFENVIAPAGWTLPSHFSLLTGLDAIRHPAHFDTFAARTSQFDLLAERLRAAGYTCQAITGGGFVHPYYGFAQGFDSYVSWPADRDRDDELSSHVARAIAWLEKAGSEPFFLFFHTFEVHTPNRARQPFFSRFSSLAANLEAVAEGVAPTPAAGFLGSSTWRLAAPDGGSAGPLPDELAALPSDLYDSAVGYADFHLHDLLAALERNGLGERTAVVVTSDHGEALGEGGRASHGHLFESNLRVPLIVALPGGVPRREPIAPQARLIDLFPTLLELAGLEAPADIDALALTGWLTGRQQPVARPAWSYAALSSDGLALSDGRGHKLEWRDTVWRPAAGRVRLVDVDGRGEGRPAAGPLAEPLARRLEGVARRYFAARHAGIRLELRAPGARPAHVVLESALVAPASVKSPDLAPPYLAWRNMGELELDLASRASATLVFQQFSGDAVSLVGHASRPGCARAAIWELHESFAALAAGKQVQIADPCGDGILLDSRLTWIGRLPSGTEKALDPALAADLRALGYLK